MDIQSIVIINNQIMPYRIPLFNKLSLGILHNLTILYCSERANDRQWMLDKSQIHYNFDILRNWSIKIPKRSYQDEWRFIRFNPTLLFELMKRRPDLIIAYEYSLPTIIAMIYTKIFRCKLMIWSEMTAHTDRQLSKGQEIMRRQIIPRADGFIGTSNAACDNFRRRGIDDDKIFLAPQTYVAQYFDPDIREDDHPPTVIYAGYLSERKGVKYLVEAFAKVVETLPTTQLCLIGDGHERPMLEALISQYNLSEQVTLTGFVEPHDIPRYYAQGDIFVLPSLEDTFGVVTIEAIAAGLPLICSPYAGFSSHMTHGENGLVIDPTDQAALVNTMVRLLSEPETRERMNQEAQKLLPDFMPENVAKQFITAIDQTLMSPS